MGKKKNKINAILNSVEVKVEVGVELGNINNTNNNYNKTNSTQLGFDLIVISLVLHLVSPLKNSVQGRQNYIFWEKKWTVSEFL